MATHLVHYVVTRSLIVSLVILYGTYCGLSHFGAPNPNVQGLSSGIAIAALGLAITLIGAAYSRLLFITFLVILWLLFCIITFANWEYHSVSRSYFNYQVLRLGSSLIESNKAAGALQHVHSEFTFAIVTFSCVLYASLLYRRAAFPKLQTLIASAILFIFSFFVLMEIEGTFDKMRWINTFSLNPVYLHPVHAFFTDDGDSAVEDDRSWKKLKALNANALTHNNRLESTSVELVPVTSPHTRNYNVIMIVIESFRASFIGRYGSRDGLTPNFDFISRSRKSIVANKFYANSNFTVKSEVAILCGMLDHNAKPSIAQYNQAKSLRCLPQILSQNGYKSIYLHGYQGEFYNRTSFMNEIGFDDLYFHGDRDPGAMTNSNHIGWGVSDVDMYRMLLDRATEINQRGELFFSYLLTLSSHYPFTTPWPIEVPFETTVDFSVLSDHEKTQALYNNYRNAVYYSDYALGSFWDAFQKTPLRDNTIVIITADHGIWSFDKPPSNNSAVSNNETFFRLPFLMYHPNLRKKIFVEQVSSQIDILPTLLATLEIEMDVDGYLGKNILKPVVSPWAVMMKSGLVYVRFPSSMCHTHLDGCGNAHQSCTHKEREDLAEIVSSKTCSSITGDLLTAGTVTSHAPDVEWIDAALGTIRYENFRAFANSTAVESTTSRALTNLEVRTRERLQKNFARKQVSESVIK